MNEMTADELFDRRFRGLANFMTPEIIERAWVTPRLAYELAKGIGLRGEPIFGVTVLEYDRATDHITTRSDLSTMFLHLCSARVHIRNLEPTEV